MSKAVYENPLISRYSSREMLRIFSPDFKFTTWRKLWVALAEAERSLGLPISQRQIAELKARQNNVNYAVAEKRERITRHDVMAHVYAYGRQCPRARGIIHLGATSAYVTDNTDLIQLRDGLTLVIARLLKVIEALAEFAKKYRRLPTLGFTHFQPAQLTTVGKRATLWIHEFLMDLEDLEHQLNDLRFLGVKGTTGTQASFLHLFNGNHGKVKRLDGLVTRKLGFKEAYAVSGQTYSRKVDARILAALSGLAQSAHKMTSDLRLLQNLKEIEEPFEKGQIGSSAMAYKQNPMRSERVASLARYVISLAGSAAFTSATQWFERTLDDSANKRLSVPEAFLAADAILILLQNIASGLVVHPKMIAANIRRELPFMATENILMAAVKKGGDRQALHEKIRRYSRQTGDRIKEEGLSNNLLELIAADPSFGLNLSDLKTVLKPGNYVGRAPQQTEEFLRLQVRSALRKLKSYTYKDKAGLWV